MKIQFLIHTQTEHIEKHSASLKRIQSQSKWQSVFSIVRIYCDFMLKVIIDLFFFWLTGIHWNDKRRIDEIR